MSVAVLTLNMRFIPPYIYLFLSDTEKINRCTSIGVGVEDQLGYASLSHVILLEGQLPTTVCLRLHFSVTIRTEWKYTDSSVYGDVLAEFN